MPAANAETMSLHLTAIGRKVAADSHAALVLDGAGYHIAKALTIPENITLVRLPPYAPELNPIENVWEYLRGNKLAITVFDDGDRAHTPVREEGDQDRERGVAPDRAHVPRDARCRQGLRR